jgi:HlyD family secretion protein
MKHLTGMRVCAKALVPHFQHVLQQQIGHPLSKFRDSRIQCTLKRGTLQILVEHLSSVELEPQQFFLSLEQLVHKAALASTPQAGKKESVQSIRVQISLKVTEEPQAYTCHSFTLVLTEVACSASQQFHANSHHNRLEWAALDLSGATHASSPSETATVHPSQPVLESVPKLNELPETAVRSHHLAIASASEPEEQRTQKFRLFKLRPWVVGVALFTLFSAGASYYVFSQRSLTLAQAPTPTPSIAPVTSVVALGRIEPKGEIIRLSVANAQDSRVEQLLVRAGDRVEAGQVIAMLQGLDRRQAALTAAEQNVAIAQARLAQVQSGDAKTSELAAQQANIGRLEAQLRAETTEREAAIARVQIDLLNAETTYERYQKLYQSGATSLAEMETAQKNLEAVRTQLTIAQAQLDNTTSTLQRQIQQEQYQLSNLSEVRPADVQVAQAELNYALTQVEKAKAELDDLYVRAPIAGQILKINTRIGEQVNLNEGIVELGQTDQMYAIAEVYETDISKIQIGQSATIVSENGGFPGAVYGSVEQIGLQIGKNNILDSDPAATQDARVVEVRIRINPEDTLTVAGLSNMQVRVRIDLTETDQQSRR